MQDATLQLGVEEAWSASTTVVFLIIKVKEHLSEIGSDILDTGIFISRNFWAEVRCKFTTTQVGHGVTLASLQTAMKLVTVFRFVLLNIGAHRNIGGNDVGYIAQ